MKLLKTYFLITATTNKTDVIKKVISAAVIPRRNPKLIRTKLIKRFKGVAAMVSSTANFRFVLSIVIVNIN